MNQRFSFRFMFGTSKTPMQDCFSNILFLALAISSVICSKCPWCKGKAVNIWYSHWVHGVLNQLHPGVTFLSGTGVNLHHFGVCDASGDEEEAALLVGHLSHDQLLQGDNSGSLVLLMRRGSMMHRMRRAEWSRKNMQREEERKRDQRASKWETEEEIKKSADWTEHKHCSVKCVFSLLTWKKNL